MDRLLKFLAGQLPRMLESVVVMLLCLSVTLGGTNNWFLMSLTAGVGLLYLSYHSGRLMKEEYFNWWRLLNSVAVALIVALTYTWLTQPGVLVTWSAILLTVFTTDLVIDYILAITGKLPGPVGTETAGA